MLGSGTLEWSRRIAGRKSAAGTKGRDGRDTNRIMGRVNRGFLNDALPRVDIIRPGWVSEVGCDVELLTLGAEGGLVDPDEKVPTAMLRLNLLKNELVVHGVRVSWRG